jgi:simple sugar transport system permease protein
MGAGILRTYRLQVGITAVLAVLLALFAVLSPQTFLGGRIYLSFLSTIPFIAILALGLTFLVIAGELDMSFPSLMAMAGLLFAEIYLRTASPWLGLFAALAVGGLGGFINGVLVVKVGVPSIIATIGTQFFWRGLSALLASGLARNIAAIRGTDFHQLMVGRVLGIPAQALWFLVLAVLLALLLNRHVFGERVLFTGDNLRAARLNGVDTDRVRLMLFTMMGLLSAFVAVLVCLEMGNWWPTQGEGYLLLVFAAIFIGGTSVFGGRGTLYGTCVGAIIIGIIEAGIISAGFSGFWTRLVHGLIIVVSVSVYATIFRTGRS